MKGLFIKVALLLFCLGCAQACREADAANWRRVRGRVSPKGYAGSLGGVTDALFASMTWDYFWVGKDAVSASSWPAAVGGVDLDTKAGTDLLLEQSTGSLTALGGSENKMLHTDSAWGAIAKGTPSGVASYQDGDNIRLRALVQVDTIQQAHRFVRYFLSTTDALELMMITAGADLQFGVRYEAADSGQLDCVSSGSDLIGSCLGAPCLVDVLIEDLGASGWRTTIWAAGAQHNQCSGATNPGALAGNGAVYVLTWQGTSTNSPTDAGIVGFGWAADTGEMTLARHQADSAAMGL